LETRPLADLLACAANGDQASWNAVVERYLPLVYSVVRKYRLSDEDAADVSQTLWLRLVENLGSIREPRALPSWIITTTKREALRVLAARQRATPVDAINGFDTTQFDGAETDADLLRAERHQALRDGLAELSPSDRELLLLFIADPPIPYKEIAARLGVPVGSIGPTRGRALNKLRATPGIARLIGADYETDEGGDRGNLAGVRLSR
jgi:RNA polymerase sigma factor (sigma-70 family)